MTSFKKLFYLLASLCIISFSSCQFNGGKPNGEQCSNEDECQSRNCLKNRCSPVECRTDKTCIEHGLRDYYCRSRSTLIPSLFASECVPKRGISPYL